MEIQSVGPCEVCAGKVYDYLGITDYYHAPDGESAVGRYLICDLCVTSGFSAKRKDYLAEFFANGEFKRYRFPVIVSGKRKGFFKKRVVGYSFSFPDFPLSNYYSLATRSDAWDLFLQVEMVSNMEHVLREQLEHLILNNQDILEASRPRKPFRGEIWRIEVDVFVPHEKAL